jgi:hypothetical protein
MSNKDQGNAFIGLGLVGLIGEIFDLIYSEPSRPTGRWSLVFGPLFDSFGFIGLSVIYLFIGFIFVIFGLFLRGKK